MTGMHHSFIAIETQLLADSARTGGSFISPQPYTYIYLAQGTAVLAVLLLTKNEKMKSICSASGVSALLGITEPAMFGVTLKLKYPLLRGHGRVCGGKRISGRYKDACPGSWRGGAARIYFHEALRLWKFPPSA